MLKATERINSPSETLPLIGHAYDWPTELIVLWNKVTGPSQRHAGLTSFIPGRRRFGKIEPRARIVFLGDVLPGCGREYRVASGMREFLKDADYLVLNLEGTICSQKGVLNAVRHDRGILDFLAELFPPRRTIVLCANNHAADCGREALERSCRELAERGFRATGTPAEPSIMLPEGIQLSNGTEWLNVRRPYVPRLADADAAWEEAARLRVLCPHWGTEMTLYPSPRQVERAGRLLERWDLIVGHHPHCPQPIADVNGQLVAYSLGSFARGDGGERGWHGAALRATIGPDAAGQWRLGETQWTFVVQTPQPDGALLIDAASTCRFFPAPE